MVVQVLAMQRVGDGDQLSCLRVRLLRLAEHSQQYDNPVKGWQVQGGQ